MATALCNFVPARIPGWTTTMWNTDGVPTRGPATARQWAAAMPYDVEQALVLGRDSHGGFSLRVVTLNERGYGRKKTEF